MAYNTEYLGPPLLGVTKEWPITTLEMVCLDIFDCPHSTPKLTNKGPYMVRTQDIRNGYFDLSSAVHVSYETYAERTKRAIPTSGDIFLSREGTYFGDAAEVPKDIDVCLGQRMVLLRPNPSLIRSSFLRIWINSRLFQNYLKAFRDGTVAERVNVSTIRQLPIPIPSFSVQDNIISNVLVLEQKEALNRRMNQTLEAMAQAIFQSWFVDFDPVKAKMAALATGRDPERAAMAALAGKLVVPKNIDEISIDDLDAAAAALDQLSEQQRVQLAQTAALFPAELVESESDFGLIPCGWELSEIGKEVIIYGGATPSTQNPIYWDGGAYHWATPKDLSDLSDHVILDTERKITIEGVNKISSGQLPRGTVLMSSRAPVGYLALATKPISINQGFIAMVCDGRLSSTYVLQWAKHNMGEISQRAGGSTFAEISKKDFRPIQCLVPSRDIETQFASFSFNLYAKIESNARQSQTLAQLRDTLLPKLLSGELSVTELEELTERA